MKHVTIREPIWNGGEYKVGIAEAKIPCTITIDWEDNDGDKLFPHNYYLTRKLALTCPTQEVKGGVVLRIVPVKKLSRIGER